MAVMILIMMPLAITEIGTDGWITEIMESFAKRSGMPPISVLIYTSAIMLVLRFFAGPIIKALTPLGLLIISASLRSSVLLSLQVLLRLSLQRLSTRLKTFFWPTVLGIVAEQTPKGGALSTQRDLRDRYACLWCAWFPTSWSLQIRLKRLILRMLFLSMKFQQSLRS